MPDKVIPLERRADRPGEIPAAAVDEAILIRRVRDGEHDLFYELIRPYERRVYAAAFAILRNEADAEDAAQEAMLKAFKHIRQFRAEARFSTWLIQITVNEARMRRRKAHANIAGTDRRIDRTKRATTSRAILPTGVRFRRKPWNEKRFDKS